MIIKKKRIKKGSSILMILAISMVIIILSGVVTSAMLLTTKANKFEKIDDDLLYAAEGGSEVGVTLLRKDARFENSVGSSTVQTEINSATDKLKNKTVHSVETVTKSLVTGKRVMITSTAYGYASDGVNIDTNKKKIVEKTIVKSGSPTSGKIFQNSIVAQDNVVVDLVGSGNMSTTQITGGGNIDLPTAGGGIVLPDPSKIKNDRIQSSIFKPQVNPKIRKKGTITTTQIDVAGGITTIDGVINTGGLSDIANLLQPDGSTISNNGIGKFSRANFMGVIYNIILVNADRLVIRPSSTLNLTKTIVVCSGDIEIEITAAGNTLSRSTFFARNVSVTRPGALSIDNAPANGTTSEDLGNIDSASTRDDLTAIDLVMSKYIENWGTGAGGVPGGGSGDVWQEVDSETIYK